MADYQFTSSGVQRLADGAWIPNDPRNGDWVAYLAWAATNGNVADPAPAPPAPPPAGLTVDKLAALLVAKAGLPIVQADIDALKINGKP